MHKVWEFIILFFQCIFENILEMLRKGATPESIYQEALAAQEKLNKEAAEDLKIFCKKGMVPPLGGATDDAAFAKAGFRATGITGLNHKLENYYHTRRDTYDNMNEQGLADCFAVSVRALEMFDDGAKQ